MCIIKLIKISKNFITMKLLLIILFTGLCLAYMSYLIYIEGYNEEIVKLLINYLILYMYFYTFFISIYFLNRLVVNKWMQWKMIKDIKFVLLMVSSFS